MTRILAVWPFVAAMAIVVAASNFLVQFPFSYLGLGEILTWGAFTYPIAFLINDLTNRRFGPEAARRVVMVGFVLAMVLSVLLASPRIALASGSAFLVAQLLDVAIFDRLRKTAWWQAPLISTIIGSALDTALFFSLAFAAAFSFLDTGLGLEDGSLAFPVPLFGMGIEVPLWVSLALGDLVVKLLVGLAMLIPYGALITVLRPAEAVR
ncbi:queuosine precursor transporter [Chelativorans salis]|uniref:Probable queuosine precursor transporter n=1 Tax=Chelativorans salis TaxID=2978478 RepID=A0ABT2LSB5_9HYPH|nr:queuosine precursor transporter [Chelativorans sp. EGI FJ00035]MCT7377364.1 queuosine precursor transporter [Chelativorans sp. EGI FJ00035]